MPRRITVSDVAATIGKAMRTSTCESALTYRPGELDPSGVLLYFNVARQRFLISVSDDVAPVAQRVTAIPIPLPFPDRED